ncbi:hypothetical protein L6278_02020 [Candidatus Parcubacteria bacterium]|nr:hypothetical protein [Patescibacteria group bacterium]MCG2686894.1 hypothetical protein [Candidatus Parcubacteria bacterium]
MYNKNYTNYQNKYKSSYSPKKAVKNFRDLEVYQKSLEGSVFVCNEVVNFLKAGKEKESKMNDYENLIENSIIKNMLQCALSIPHLIAESHSKRFGSSTECLNILDEVMLKCNKMVAYLEQTRDILNTGIETDRFEEEIKKYFHVRQKVLNLQRVWRKYINENQESRIKK